MIKCNELFYSNDYKIIGIENRNGGGSAALYIIWNQLITKYDHSMRNQEPKALWNHFYSLTQIPRPSGKKKEISDFLADFGRSLGLETIQDEIGNVIIRKPASAGMEDHPGVILQGHMDMVPQKNSDKVFDFEKDPI